MHHKKKIYKVIFTLISMHVLEKLRSHSFPEEYPVHQCYQIKKTLAES